LIVLVFGGCGDFCNPLGNVTATVVLQGDADLALPAPVTLRGVVIGRVSQVTLDAGNRPVLVLCLEKKPARNLGEPTVFYIDRSGAGASLACEPAPVARTSDKEKTTTQGERVYLGFSSYEEYLAWRSANLVKEGVSGFLDALDQALGSFKEQVQPDPAVKKPQ
jgi:hypothetical protein